MPRSQTILEMDSNRFTPQECKKLILLTPTVDIPQWTCSCESCLASNDNANFKEMLVEEDSVHRTVGDDASDVDTRRDIQIHHNKESSLSDEGKHVQCGR